MPSIQSLFMKTLLIFQSLFSGSREELEVTKERNDLENMGKMFKVPRQFKRIPVEIGKLQAEWIVPDEVQSKRTILYFHGGSYLAGSITSHQGMVANIAIAAKTRALMLDYRLAPEHPFPSAILDGLSAYEWMIKNGTSPDDVIIAGDSAGGGLTLALLLKIRDLNRDLPTMAVCLSPWTDLAGKGESIASNARKDIILNSKNLQKAARLYLKDESDLNPYASPIYADLKGLPSIMIQVGSDEILLSDSVNLAEKAKIAGVDVALEVWDGMQHVWQFGGKVLPEARKAIQSIGDFINR